MTGDARSTRRELLGAGAGAGVLLLAGCSAPEPEPGETLEIHHVDIGTGDATILVTQDDEAIVIDTGDWPLEGQVVINYLEFLGIEHVDHLIATHPHADHVGGHAELIEHFETERDGIGVIYDSGMPHDSVPYNDYLDAVEEYGHELLTVREGESLPVDGPNVFAVNPPEDELGDDLNNNSIALTIGHGSVDYLTTGDAEEEAESWMVSEWDVSLPADIYQVGHHGSSTSSTDSFVDAVDPDMGVISSDYDSDFGHPTDEVLYQLDDFDVETYWTGVHGDAVMTIEEGNVTTGTDDDFSTDPLDIMEAKPTTESDSLVPSGLDGTEATTLVVDRIEGGMAVLLSESGEELTGQATVPPQRLPGGADEGTVLSATIEEGTIRDMEVDAGATEQRHQAIVERLEQLSTPLSETR